MTPGLARIDVALAAQQHARYVETLKYLGLTITQLPADDALPDCCFVEDCAVIAGDTGLICMPGTPSRRGEQNAVRDAVASRLRTVSMHLPNTLDGGDVMRIGRRIYVGASTRTNAGGIEQLRSLFESDGYEVISVPVKQDTLHLKCACSPLGDGVLVAEGAFPAGTFADLRVITIPREEAYAANVVSVGRTVVMAEGYPKVRRAIEVAGFDVIALDVSELHKADGSLTCLSILD